MFMRICVHVCTDVQKAQRHTYRYSTTIASTLKGPSLGGNQLALDCVVDIDVRPGCPEMTLKVCFLYYLIRFTNVSDTLVSCYFKPYNILLVFMFLYLRI